LRRPARARLARRRPRRLWLTNTLRAASGKPGASMAGVTVVDGSGDPSAEDVLRGVLANASVASVFSSPQFTYTATTDTKGARAPRGAPGARGRVSDGENEREGEQELDLGSLACRAGVICAPPAPFAQQRERAPAAPRARTALPGPRGERDGRPGRAAAGLDNLMNKNYDYAVSSLALPASTLAAQQAAGCAQGRIRALQVWGRAKQARGCEQTRSALERGQGPARTFHRMCPACYATELRGRPAPGRAFFAPRRRAASGAGAARSRTGAAARRRTFVQVPFAVSLVAIVYNLPGAAPGLLV